jgi:hypothetical protein
VTALTDATSKAKDHAAAARELRQALGAHADAATAEKSLRDLVSIKGDVEYGTTLITLAKADPLVRRARTLVDLANQLVRPSTRKAQGSGPVAYSSVTRSCRRWQRQTGSASGC